MRLNRSLLSLSLANNDIGDVGATRLAQVGATPPPAGGYGRTPILTPPRHQPPPQVLAPFALTHAEVVERRRLLLAQALVRPSNGGGPGGGGCTEPPPVRPPQTLKETQGQSQRSPSQRSHHGAPDKLGKAPPKKKVRRPRGGGLCLSFPSSIAGDPGGGGVHEPLSLAGAAAEGGGQEPQEA